MLSLLLFKLNDSRSMVSVIYWKHASPIMMNVEQETEYGLIHPCMVLHVASLGNFVESVVMRVEQRSDSVLFSTPRIRLLSKELTNSWIMVSVGFMGNHAPPVVMKIEQQLEHSLC